LIGGGMSKQESGKIFSEQAGQYDEWYDSPKGKALFAAEVECLKPLMALFPRPWLEVGVGTGRFAAALAIEHGIDPSHAALEIAKRRGVRTVIGSGESVPFPDAGFGCVLMAFALCFVQDPPAVLREVRRVLRPDGGLALGLLLRGTPWADWYARRGAEGHAIYRAARFHSQDEVLSLLGANGFRVVRWRSTLFQKPGLETYSEETAKEGFAPDAGFAAVAAARAKSPVP
jgi:ubiquinone/menaquinone biosynthesis C-methylase UbiE